MIDALIGVYEAFSAHIGLELGSADEHLHDERLTEAQRIWLVRFINLWEQSQSLEDQSC